MPENILVVEYEPRYTDRVKQALSGQPFTPSFAHDGEEAIKALDTQKPRLIVLSSVVPKISAADLIRKIRERKALESTPILLTVSGYAGRTPKQDAEKVGASDILPKPYSEIEFLGKVNEMIGATGHLTSNDIFGDILDEKPAEARKPMKPTDDVDKLLEQTLGGVMPKKKDPHATPTSPGSVPLPKKSQPGTTEIDKLVQDTLSGLEKKKPKTPTIPPNVTPVPAPAPAPAAAPPPAPAPSNDNVLQSQPVMAAAAAPAAEVKDEEEPTDGVKYGQYVLLEKIAAGGMAEVWKARMRGVEGFQKIVAIKRILPHLSDNQDFIEMFIDEAKLAAQLNHNNIIHIYDLGKTQGTYFIAMEYVDGHDLKTILKRGGDRSPLGVELSLFIASKIAAALDYAHRRRDFEEKEMGLVHRDVSPQNVLISQEGDIKLCDFGIAKAASKASHTQAGALKGKLQYMSPEQAWGKTIDRRSDIFALATVLYEMLTGKKLFTGENEISILEQVREAHVTAPSEINDEVTPQIDAVVLKALKKEPSDRYQTAGEMARDIDSILYAMKPTPTSADLAIYMHRLWSEEPSPVHGIDEPAAVAAAPIPEAAPAVEAAAAPGAVRTTTSPGVPMPPWEAPAKKKSPVVPLAIVAGLFVAIVGGYFVVRSRSNGSAPQKVASATQAPIAAATIAPPSAAPVTTSATQTIAPVTTSSAAVATQAPAVDQAQVDAEVQRRIAAERARLDQKAREQQAAQIAPLTPPVQQRSTPAVTASQPPAPTPQPATQTVAPPPVPAPVTQTVAQQPPPAQETAAPTPQRAREGDLVPSGTEGLTPPRVAKQAPPQYPPIARVQRIEGSVIVNVLVNETGQAQEMRIISGGTGRAALLGEAALQSIRRSTFTPGMKDGAHVKAWTTVRVDFKL